MSRVLTPTNDGASCPHCNCFEDAYDAGSNIARSKKTWGFTLMIRLAATCVAVASLMALAGCSAGNTTRRQKLRAVRRKTPCWASPMMARSNPRARWQAAAHRSPPWKLPTRGQQARRQSREGQNRPRAAVLGKRARRSTPVQPDEDHRSRSAFVITGIPRYTSVQPFEEILQTPERLGTFRYSRAGICAGCGSTVARKRVNPDARYLSNAVGHWEGDTLVRSNPASSRPARTAGSWLDDNGNPQSSRSARRWKLSDGRGRISRHLGNLTAPPTPIRCTHPRLCPSSTGLGARRAR